MKKLFVYLRQYRIQSIIAPLFKFFEAMFDLLVPVVVAKIIDVGVARGDHAYIVRQFLLLLLMAAIGLSCTIIAQYYAAKVSVSVAADLRQSLFDHIQSLSFTELDTLGADTMITRLNDDVNQIQNGLNLALRLLLRSPFIVFGAMIMAFTINVRCALIFAIAIPVLFAVTFLIMLISIPLFKKVQNSLDHITGLTRENLTGVRVIRAFCQEEHSVEEFEKKNLALTHLNEFVGRISALLNPLTYVLINIATVFLIERASIQVNLGNMKQGEVLALYNYMLQIIVELVKLASLIISINRALACTDRVSSILDVESSMHYPDAASKDWEVTDDKDVVRFEDVSFLYKDSGAPILSHISFQIKRGQTVGIIGGTGSGKSSLINLIPRFYDVSEGAVYVDGHNVKEYTQDELNKKVGVVQQKSVLFQGSIRENLLWGNENADDALLWEALTAAQAKEIVEGKLEGLNYMLKQNGRNLSGGQKQRLSIARTLVKKPEILILDDSSSALDFATDAALRKALHELGTLTTTFLVSQRIAGIRQADLILVLDNGHLCGKGSHESLMDSCQIYREIYFSQFPEERCHYPNLTTERSVN